MRKIINGRVYDTSTAKLIAAWMDKENPPSTELLYQKKTGEFFLFRQSIQDDMTVEILAALTLNGAKSWVKERQKESLYKELFGAEEDKPELSGEMARINLYMDSGLLNFVKRRAVEEGKSTNDWIINLIRKQGQKERWR